MMTRRTVEPKMYYNFSLDEKVPKDHLLRKINEAIDFSFIYPLVKEHYSHTGAPSVDPVVVFKLSLIGYLYDIASERRLLEDASLNMAYLWFLGYEIDEPLPDHSILTKARIRFGADIYREFFHHIVKACADEGLINGETLFMDSTLIDSAASYAQGRAVRSKALVDALKNKADDFVEQVFEQNTEPDEDKEEQDTKPKTDMKTNQMLASKTDPEADIVRRGKKNPRLAYKGHFAVDGSAARIVTAVGVSSGTEHDAHFILPLLSEHSMCAKTPDMLAADMGYSTADAYYLLKAKKITPAIPKKPTGRPSRAIPKDMFSYDKDTNTYTCPEGKTLSRSGINNKSITYRSKKKGCNSCPIKEKCIQGKAKTRTVTRSKDELIFEWANGHLNTQRARAALKRRKIWPETAFADAKNNHGMGRAKHRGRWKVEIQVLLTAAVINIKKLVKYSGKFKATGHAAGIGAIKPLFIGLTD